MADGLNRATLLGNLGSDPELRYTPNNRPVLKFRLATTESYLDQNNARQEVTQWHNVVLWGKRGEALSKILTKGTKVYVEGRIENSSYDDKDGVKRYRSEVSCTNLILLGGRGESHGASPGGGPGGGSNPRPVGGSPGGASRPTDSGSGGGQPSPLHDDGPLDEMGGGGGSDDDIPF